MGYYLGFGLASAVLGAVLFVLVYSSTDWIPYPVWVIAWSVTTFVIYGVDKALAKASGPRVPEPVMHLLALIGGFPGGWLGMALFGHKTNFRKHPLFVPVLVVATALHAVLVYVWFVQRG
jgi:uncharacterized membrane protein YsdA (DUF1294 family)